MNLKINNVTIEVLKNVVTGLESLETNLTQIKKAIEEFEKSDEIQVGDMYWYKCNTGFVVSGASSIWSEHEVDFYRKDQDNCLPCKNYTHDQAKEYFDKRDARRAAETKLRKIIGDMNKKDGFVAKFDGVQENHFSITDYTVKSDTCIRFFSSTIQFLPLWRYSSKETAQFINENHADLLKAYLNG